MKLTDRDKIAHLYRRFSFGGTINEIDQGVIDGYEKTLNKLVDYQSVPSNFSIHPYEFFWKEKEEAEIGTYRWRLWWALSMATTTRPLQEKLSLFWHSHFAVSDAKVEHGMLMLEYMQDIRSNANGKFGTLLKAMAKSPAMMRYLDMERAFKGHPNENFAREVMELFTMGIGNYSEKDVQECSRALTGWAFLDTFWEAGKDQTERLATLYRDKRPSGAFCYMPAMRDTEPKTILGTTKDFDGDGVLDFLAARPETAKYISKKLWEFFVYADPEPAVVDRIANVFTKTGGDIKQVMLAIGKSPEFVSEKSVLKHFKSPADYLIGTCRQMGLGDSLVAMRPKDAHPTKPIPQVIVDNTAAMVYHMGRMGLDLAYPADVSGWKWGENWISASMMTYRMQYHGMMIWNDKGAWVGTRNTAEMVKKVEPKTIDALHDRIKQIFDLNLNESADKLLKKFLTEQGVECYKNENQWSGVIYTCLKTLSACPDMHIC